MREKNLGKQSQVYTDFAAPISFRNSIDFQDFHFLFPLHRIPKKYFYIFSSLLSFAAREKLRHKHSLGKQKKAKYSLGT